MADKKKSESKQATGPINPTLDADPDYANETEARTSYPWEADPTADVDDSSASALAVVNEARESGHPFNEKDDSRPTDAQPATDPAGTGVSAPAP